MNTIGCLEYDDGRVTKDDGEMEEVARSYFQIMFLTSEVEDADHILLWVKRCISNDLSQMLMEKYTEEEVYSTLKDIGPTKRLEQMDSRLYSFKNISM